jgi:hypothetical protein
MSALAVTVPDMDDLIPLAALAADYAAREHLTLIPAVPQHDYGPEVLLGPDDLDLPGFLALAGQLGSGVLYLRAGPFDPDDGEEPSANLPEHLTRHKGRTGEVTAAFAVNGIVHFWEHRTAWYAEWQALTDPPAFTRRGVDDDGDDRDDRLSDEERSRLAAELADTILADPDFRAAARRPERSRLAQRVIPPGTDRWVASNATYLAFDRAEELAQERYEQLMPRFDDLAAGLLASEAYRRASSPAVRKQVAERFLIPHGAGFWPPAWAREELYARAQLLARTPRDPAAGLF